MDLAAFAEDQFNAKDWINNAFKQSEDSVNKDAFGNALILKLQLFIQQVNESLEDLSQQVLHNLPRVLRDADSLSQEAILLQDQMRTIKEDIVNVERNTAQSMQILLKLDNVKTRILMSKKALQEADNWTTLSANVEEVFQSGDVHAIAEKLVSMQQSLKILVDVPDYKERAMHLENLKNRLEAMLSPQLITAFNTQSLDAAQVYTTIFHDINRLPELHKYYHKCHKTQLLAQWKTIVECDPEETIVEWMTNYYDILLSTWHNQIKWCNSVFTDVSPVLILSDLYTDVLKNLEPSLSFCIDAALKQQTNELLFLIELKQISERFAKSLEVAIQSYGPSYLGTDSVFLLVQAIFLPYLNYVERFPIYIENLLTANLSCIDTEGDDLIDTIHLLSDSISKVFALATEANEHCINFTKGCFYFGLSSALKPFFVSYIARFDKVTNKLKTTLKETKKGISLCDDWSMFQNILLLNQICGELLIQTENLDQMLISNQMNMARKWNYFSEEKRESNSFQTPDKIILNKSLQRTLNITLSKLQLAEEDCSLIPEIKEIIGKLCDRTVKATFEIIFLQIQDYLAALPDMKIWKEESNALESELPIFSIAPLEHITQVGQYLMTLPQHIEPFVLPENLALKAVFKRSKFLSSVALVESDPIEQLADYLLNCIVQGTLQIYIDTIMKFKELTSHSTKQLITDIEYICNVLDDLDLKPLPNLQTMLILLKAVPDEYQTIADGKPSHLVNHVRTMRGLKLI